MKRYKKISMWPAYPMAIAALALGVAAPVGWVNAQGTKSFTVAKLFFQLNDTDGDLGIHAIIDGEPWKTLTIKAPNNDQELLLDITAMSTLSQQGLTELRFESAEPPFDELHPSVFFGRFPKGEYDIEGVTLKGEERESTVEITHVLPAPPDNLQVSKVDTPSDCDAGPVPSIHLPVIISWDPVTQSHPEIGSSGPIKIVRYEVAVERKKPTTLVMTFDVPPSVTKLPIPSALIASGDEIKFQVLATDAGGNETSSESCFKVK